MQKSTVHSMHMDDEEFQITRQLVALGIETGALPLDMVREIADAWGIRGVPTKKDMLENQFGHKGFYFHG